MGAYYTATMAIGGTMTVSVFKELCHVLAEMELKAEFEDDSIFVVDPNASEGRITELEDFCLEHELPFYATSGVFEDETVIWSDGKQMLIIPAHQGQPVVPFAEIRTLLDADLSCEDLRDQLEELIPDVTIPPLDIPGETGEVFIP